MVENSHITVDSLKLNHRALEMHMPGGWSSPGHSWEGGFRPGLQAGNSTEGILSQSPGKEGQGLAGGRERPPPHFQPEGSPELCPAASERTVPLTISWKSVGGATCLRVVRGTPPPLQCHYVRPSAVWVEAGPEPLGDPGSPGTAPPAAAHLGWGVLGAPHVTAHWESAGQTDEGCPHVLPATPLPLSPPPPRPLPGQPA